MQKKARKKTEYKWQNENRQTDRVTSLSLLLTGVFHFATYRKIML